MKNIFFAFTAGIGPVMRTGEVLKRLSEQKHYKIFYFCPNGMELLFSYCKNYIPLQYLLHSNYPIPKHGKWINEDHHSAMFGYLDQEMLEYNIDLFLNAFSNLKIDLCISDLCMEANLACKVLNIPCISITQSCYHPLATNGRVRWWEDNNERPPVIYPNVNKFLKKHKKNNTVFAKAEEIFIGDITIIPSFREFDILTDASATLFCGPMVLESDAASKENKDVIKYLNKLRRLSKKIVSVYPGRLHDSSGATGTKIIKTLEKVLLSKASAEYHFVIYTGGMWKKEDYNLMSHLENKRYRIIDIFIPNETLFNYSDILIHHGGHGISLASIEHGVPNIAVPTHSEREYNSRSLERLGTGKMLSVDELSADSMINALNELSSNPIYIQNITYWLNTIKGRNYPRENLVIEKANEILTG